MCGEWGTYGCWGAPKGAGGGAGGGGGWGGGRVLGEKGRGELKKWGLALRGEQGPWVAVGHPWVLGGVVGAGEGTGCWGGKWGALKK